MSVERIATPGSSSFEVLGIFKVELSALAVFPGPGHSALEVVNTGIMGGEGLAFMGFHSFEGANSYNNMPVVNSIQDADSSPSSGGIWYTYNIFGQIEDNELVLYVEGINYLSLNGQSASTVTIYIFRVPGISS